MWGCGGGRVGGGTQPRMTGRGMGLRAGGQVRAWGDRPAARVRGRACSPGCRRSLSGVWPWECVCPRVRACVYTAGVRACVCGARANISNVEAAGGLRGDRCPAVPTCVHVRKLLPGAAGETAHAAVPHPRRGPHFLPVQAPSFCPQSGTASGRRWRGTSWRR